jgi:PAS domain S-box-containing protein
VNERETVSDGTDVSFPHASVGDEPALFVTDDVGRVVSVTAPFGELVGREPERIVGMQQPYPWWPEDQRSWFAAQLGHRLESAARRATFEGEHVSASGRRFRVAGTISRLTGAGGRSAGLAWSLHETGDPQPTVGPPTGRGAGTVRDVGLQSAVRRLADANVIGILTGEGDRIVTANDAFLEIIGFSRAQLESGTIDWPSITPPEWLEVDAAAGEQMMRTGSSGPIEKEYLRADGSRVRVRITGAVVGLEPFTWMSFVKDITEKVPQDPSLAHGQLDESAELREEMQAEIDRVVQRAEEQQRQFDEAIASRDVIGQAKGILMVGWRVDADAAFELLREASSRNNRKLRDIAQAVLDHHVRRL